VRVALAARARLADSVSRGLACDCNSARPSLIFDSADQSRRVFVALQRRGDNAREASVARLTGARLVYILAGHFASNFGQPTVFMNPRRVMMSARLNLGR
jgi:hypothetical protein